MILSARGEFREAAKSLAHDKADGLVPATTKANFAVCLEKLGIRQAGEFKPRAS
jgi:hypothetical protein